MFLHSVFKLFSSFARIGIDSDSEPVEVHWRAKKDERFRQSGEQCGEPWDPLRRTPDIISFHPLTQIRK